MDPAAPKEIAEELAEPQDYSFLYFVSRIR